MAISGFTPTTALPTLAPGGTMLAGSNPLLAAQGGTMPTSAGLAAQAGVGERPGIGSRLMSAMRAAVGELRGDGVNDAQLRTQMLAMHAQAPRAAAKPATTDRPRRAKNVKSAKSWKTLANPPKAAVAPTATQPTAGSSLPANATALPGATVYSYDANGQPVMAPTMQQLGVSPTMLQGIHGLTQTVDPDGPQLNATNQTNLSGIGSGTGLGTPVPVLGQPILNAPVTSPGDAAPATPHAASGGTQLVTNRNSTDQSHRGFGYGGYGSPFDPTGGVASPYSPYGASMTGAYALGGERRGFLSRLFG